MTDSLVLYEVDGAVGIITMNRPDKLNAINPDLRIALVDAFKRADEDHADLGGALARERALLLRRLRHRPYGPRPRRLEIRQHQVAPILERTR